MKKFIIGVGVVILLLAVLVILLPFVIDLNRYQAQYLPKIEEALNRKVKLQSIRLMLIPRIGARISGFTVMDDPAFSAGPFASLASLDIGVKWRPLLIGRVEVEEITLRDPVITVTKDRRGMLNTSTLGRKTPAKIETPTPAPAAEGPLHILAMLAFDRVSITGGKIVYRDLSAPKPSEYQLERLELLLKSVGLGQSPSLHLAAVLQPVNLPIQVDGTVGPLKETMDIQNINTTISLSKTVFTVKGSDVGGNVRLAIRSPVVSTAGLPGGSALKKPIEAKDLQMDVEAKDSRIRLSNLSFNLFEGQLKMQGGMTTGSDSPPFDGKLQVQGLPLKPVLDAVGTEKVSISGTAGAQLAVHGLGFSIPDLTGSLAGTGHIEAKDGKIEGINLLKEAFTLLRLVGIQHDITNATAFSIIESDLSINHGIITVERLRMDSNDFQATVTGTIGFDQKLNLRAKLNLSEGLSKSISRSANVAKIAMTGNRITVPMIITGTVSAPVYALDTKAMGAKVQERVKKKAKEKVRELLYIAT
jgi:AsmA protein